MDRQERRNVPAVEKTNVAQVYRLLEQHRRRDHLLRDEVPGGPHVLPLFHGRQRERRPCDVLRALALGVLDQRERETGSFEEPERILRRAVRPAVDGAQIGVGEERVCVAFRELR